MCTDSVNELDSDLLYNSEFFFKVLKAIIGNAWVPIIKSGLVSSRSFFNFLDIIAVRGLSLNSFLDIKFDSDNLYTPPHAFGVYLADFSYPLDITLSIVLFTIFKLSIISQSIVIPLISLFVSSSFIALAALLCPPPVEADIIKTFLCIIKSS